MVLKALQCKMTLQDELLLQMTVAVAAERRRCRWWQRGGNMAAGSAARAAQSNEFWNGRNIQIRNRRVPVSNVVL